MGVCECEGGVVSVVEGLFSIPIAPFPPVPKYSFC